MTTSLGAEGMGLPGASSSHHEAEEHVASVADDADEFVAALVALCSDRALWQKRRDAGRKHLRSHFSESAQQRALAALLADLGPW